jgi:PKD repeat protein
VVREEIMKRILIACILLLCLIPFVSAIWTYPPVAEITGCVDWDGTFPKSNAFDGNVTSFWSSNGGCGYLQWNNTANVTSIRVKSSGSITYSITDSTGTGGGATVADDGNWHEIMMSHPSIDYIRVAGGSWGSIRELQYNVSASYFPAPIANFTAAPLNATAPAYVAFTDTSQNEYGTCTYNWSYTPTTGVLVAPQDLDNEDITMLFTENGNFTISHGVSCAAGSNISTKTDYIHIFNATALSTFRVRAVDAISGYGINGAAIGVFDVENTSWTNQTATVGEVTVSALTGHTINAYGSATGYDDGESLGLPVVANSLYPIYMWQSNMGTNVTAGNFTLYVTVLEDGTNNRLSGYSLTVFAPNGVYTSGVTNSNGIFQTTIQNKTDYNIEVAKQKGHLGGQKIFNSGTQVGGGDAFIEQTIFLPLETVTPTTAVTTLPGGGTPTATQTVDPYPCDADHPDNCKRKQTEMGNTLVQWGPELLMLFIVATIVGTIKIMGKK